MKRIFMFIALVVISMSLFANDGVFYANGNQFVPIAGTSAHQELFGFDERLPSLI